jgi:hypothetical protein
MFALGREAGAVQDLDHVILFAALRPAGAEAGRDRDILIGRHVLEGLRDLEAAPDPGMHALPRGHRGDVLPVQRDGSACGFSRPVIRLKSEDLPAPFGPMMPSASPSCTSREMSSATTTAPKAR